MPTANSNKKTGLGKGFDALLPRDFDTAVLLDPEERIQKISLDKIEPNPEQPRHHFDKEALAQLADSIKVHGVLQPIIATPAGDMYAIIAGERRWLASKMAGLKTIPTIVRSSQQLERLEIALVENVQRVDLSLIEQAASIERLRQQFNVSYEDIAKRLGKAVSTVTNIARLLQLPDEAKQALLEGKIVEGHARQILSLKGHPDKQRELLELTVKNGWSVRQSERFVTAFKKAGPGTAVTELQARISSETPQTKQLGKQLKAPVSIRRMAHGGKLEIGFNSDEDLERLLEFLISRN